jgi:hypothetical protein
VSAEELFANAPAALVTIAAVAGSLCLFLGIYVHFQRIKASVASSPQMVVPATTGTWDQSVEMPPKEYAHVVVGGVKYRVLREMHWEREPQLEPHEAGTASTVLVKMPDGSEVQYRLGQAQIPALFQLLKSSPISSTSGVEPTTLPLG